MTTIGARLIAATYVGHGSYRWQVRVPTFPTVYDLRLRLHAEHCLSMGLSDNAETLAGKFVAEEVRDQRVANFYQAEFYLAQLPDSSALR
jgi:hypothetical protein